MKIIKDLKKKPSNCNKQKNNKRMADPMDLGDLLGASGSAYGQDEQIELEQQLAKLTGLVTNLGSLQASQLKSTSEAFCKIAAMYQAQFAQAPNTAAAAAGAASGSSSAHGSEPSSAMTHIARHMKPPIFFGDRDAGELDTWAFQLTKYLALQPNLTPQDQVNVAGLMLKGQAACWYRDICQRPAAMQPHDLDTFLGELRTVFQPLGRDKQARDQLSTAHMRPRDSLGVYTTHIRKLFLSIPNISEDEKLDRYVRGLTQELRREVILRQPTSFEEAVKQATLYDSVLAMARGRNPYYSPTYPVSHSQVRREHSEAVPMEIDALQRGVGSKQTGNREETQGSRMPETRRCYRCGEVGHLIRDCKSKPKSGSKNTQVPKNGQWHRRLPFRR